jgi:hypothetical protein
LRAILDPEVMAERKVHVVVQPKAVLYLAGIMYAEGDRLAMREHEARRFEEHGVITRVDPDPDHGREGMSAVRGIALGLCAGLAMYVAVVLALALG